MRSLAMCLYLFICSLFSDAVSNSDCVETNDWMVANIEMERMWRKVVMT
jgi:hypothetical protein